MWRCQRKNADKIFKTVVCAENLGVQDKVIAKQKTIPYHEAIKRESDTGRKNDMRRNYDEEACRTIAAVGVRLRTVWRGRSELPWVV